MRRSLAAFHAAVEFLTVVRLRRGRDHPAVDPGAMLVMFPLVGLLIGLLLVAVDWTSRLLFPAAVSVALVITAEVLVTGALHLDGLADSVDGLFGGRMPERRLAIMKDSRTGVFGVTAIVLTLLLIFASLASLPDSRRRGILLAAPVLARYAIALAVLSFGYARQEGLGRYFREGVSSGSRLWVTLVAVLCAALSLGVFTLGFLTAAGAVAYGTGVFASRRLGGLTGDVYGAIGVLCEVVLLLLAVALTEQGWWLGWPGW